MEKIDQEALRARFNPDGSLLRRQQMRMLEMMKEVDHICKKHNIQYWLSGGTLLGCIRHGGFIPWDDDLDLEMKVEDYKRLMKVLPEELPPTMALQTQDTDPNFFFFFAKIRDRRSYLAELNHYDRFWKERGIFIDIFPLERQPMWIHKLSELTQGHVYKIMNSMGDTKKGFWKVKLITRINRYLIYPLLRLVCLTGRYHHVNCMGIPTDIPRYMEEILPLSEAKFEDVMVPVPKHWDKVMTRQYGDYMKLPETLQNLHVDELRIDD